MSARLAGALGLVVGAALAWGAAAARIAYWRRYYDGYSARVQRYLRAREQER